MNFLSQLIKGKRFLISLKLNLHTIFLSIFLATIMLIIALESYSFSKILLFHSKNLMQSVTTSVNRELSGLLNSTNALSNLSENLLQQKVINSEDFAMMIDYTKLVLRSSPTATMVDWAKKNGSYVVSRRLPDQTIATDYLDTTKLPLRHRIIIRDLNDNITKIENAPLDYNPLTRPWFKTAQSTRKATWSNAYIFYSTTGKNIHNLGISSAVPIYSQQQFLGVFSIDMKLDSVSEFLKTHKISRNSYTFIVDGQGNIIAYPDLYIMLENRANTFDPTLINISSLKNSANRLAFNIFQKNKQGGFNFKYNNENYLASFTLIPQFKNYQWYIVSVIPEDDFVSQIKTHNMYIMAMIIALLLIAFYFISLFSKQISAPINKLANELDKIRSLNLKPLPPIHTHIKEVNTIYHSMESMKVGLESFRKYLPEKLVKHLIASGEAAKIGGKTQSLALLFSDITDFTLISEQIGANKVMHYLCEYFNEMSIAIDQHNGTIDKYIGDSVMAFWGAPIPDENSIKNACFSALECQRRIENLNTKWQHDDGILFATRIGIHYGDAIVGNIGSKERLNYTAIGDTVNLTSRLEQLNKYYGSKIIVSENVYQKVNDIFLFRILDLIIIKGRAEPTTIYQLMQQKSKEMDSALLEFCDFYSRGFSAYKQQEWDIAISLFKRALLINPDDLASRLMINRCNKFKINPPLSGWRGIWVYTHK